MPKLKTIQLSKSRKAVVPIEQDYLLRKHKYGGLTPRLVAVQFQRGERNVIAMFDLMISEDDLHVLDEKHYRLVPYSEITPEDISQMASSGSAGA